MGDVLAAKETETEIDVLKHELVPEHRILSDEEKGKLLEKFNITVKQLPRVQSTDAAVKQIDAKVGDVLEITRKSPSAGTATYYRHVVA